MLEDPLNQMFVLVLKLLMYGVYHIQFKRQTEICQFYVTKKNFNVVHSCVVYNDLPESLA